MRRSLFALLAAVALAGCGGDSDDNPLDSVLGFFGEKAPLVAVVDTDSKSEQQRAVREIAKRFPFGPQLLAQLQDPELRPLLGNPAVFGSTDARRLGDERQIAVAVQPRDPGKVEELRRRGVEERRSTNVGKEAGFRILRNTDGDLSAFDGDTLVFASSRLLLSKALRQREGDGRMTADRFGQALEGLPAQALVKLRLDAGAIVAASPDGRQAQRVPWVKSLRTLGATLSARPDSLEARFRLRSEGEVDSEDLPLAEGATSPPLAARRGELAIGLRDPAQVAEFAKRAGAATTPLFGPEQERIEQRIGIDFERDVLGQLGGNSAASVAPEGGYALRARVRDPAAMKRTLATLAKRAPDAARELGGGQTISITPPRSGRGLYLLDRIGRDAVFGLIGDTFVFASDARRAGALALAPARRVPDAQGALVVSAAPEELLRGLVRQIAPGGGLGGLFGPALFLAPLGPFGASIRAEPEALTGRFVQRFD